MAEPKEPKGPEDEEIRIVKEGLREEKEKAVRELKDDFDNGSPKGEREYLIEIEFDKEKSEDYKNKILEYLTGLNSEISSLFSKLSQKSKEPKDLGAAAKKDDLKEKYKDVIGKELHTENNENDEGSMEIKSIKGDKAEVIIRSKGVKTKKFVLGKDDLEALLDKYKVLKEDFKKTWKGKTKKASADAVDPIKIEEPKEKKPSELQKKLEELEQLKDELPEGVKIKKYENEKELKNIIAWLKNEAEALNKEYEGKLEGLMKSGKDEFEAEEELASLKKELDEKNKGLKAHEIKLKIDEAGKYFDDSRTGAKITLERLRDQNRDLEGNLIHGYKDLNADTRENSDKKFNEKTRELWRDLVTHGVLEFDEKTGKVSLGNRSDIDGGLCIQLLKKAGIDTDHFEYVAPGGLKKGKIHFDTGNREGVIVENDGTAFIDHHGENSPRNTSAAIKTYELLVKMGMLEENEALERLMKYIVETDNALDVNADNFFKGRWKTFDGIARMLKTDNGLPDIDRMIEFFEGRNADPYHELTQAEIKKFKLGNLVKSAKENSDADYRELEKMKEEGFIVDSERYGKIAVDIGKKVKLGFSSARAFGANTYIIWNPPAKSFFITSEKEITDEFPQGFGKRGSMWMKTMNDEEPLRVTLEEILKKMTDGKLEPSPQMIEYFEKEFQENKKWRKGIYDKEEDKKREEEKGKIETYIKNAEKDFQEAKEEYQVSRVSNRMRAWGVSPYDDMFPGDDYSLMKKVKRQNYEEAEAELKRLVEIAKDPEKTRQFEKEEREKAEKMRMSEAETAANKALDELGEARKEYMEMMKDKKGMWDNVGSFFGRMLGKKEDLKVGLDGVEGVRLDKNGKRIYYNSYPEKDQDAEYFKKIYQEKLAVYKKAMADYERSKGLSGEELRAKLNEIKEFININEAAKFYTGKIDALAEKNFKIKEAAKSNTGGTDASAENYSFKNDSWKISWSKEKNWLEKMPDKFAEIAEKIDDAYFRTERMAEIERIKSNKEDGELKILDEITSSTETRSIALDVIKKLSGDNVRRWSEIKNKKTGEISEDENAKKVLEKLRKVFKKEGKPKAEETVMEYAKRMTAMIYNEKLKTNESK